MQSASAKDSGHRLFIVGIGSSPAETHLRRLAEATGGACDFVAPGEAIEPAVLRMFARLRSPRLADLNIEWPAGAVPQWVSPLLPSVFDGDTVNVFALLGQAPAGQVRLLGKRAEDEAPQEIGCAVFASELESADTLPRMAAALRLRSIDADAVIATTPDAAALAVAYQLVTDKTNFLLVHERADGEKAIDMPELRKVPQMLPAGWGGTGSVSYSRSGSVFASRVGGSAPDMQVMSVPAVWRTVNKQTPSVQSSAMDDFEVAAFLRSQADDFALPAFLRKRDQIIDHHDPRYWARSEHYEGLTPLGVGEWLRITPASQWPSNYVGLRQMGLGVGLVDWLELAMATQAGTVHAESKVVEAFLYLMSRRNTYESLAKSEGLMGALQSTVLRLREVLAGGPAATPTSVDLKLVEAMVAGLDGMTTSAWPDRVFEMGGAVDEVRDAKEPSAVA